MVKEYLEITIKDINSQFDLVLEGYESLRGEICELAKITDERFDSVDFKTDTLNEKIDGVAVDLKAHRSDTEAHHGVYQVKEG